MKVVRCWTKSTKATKERTSEGQQLNFRSVQPFTLKMGSFLLAFVSFFSQKVLLRFAAIKAE